MLRFLFPPDCFDVSNFVEQAMSHQAAQNIWAKTSYPFPRQWKWQWLISRPQKYILSVSCLVLSYLIKSHWLLLPPCSLLNPIGVIYLNLTRSHFLSLPPWITEKNQIRNMILVAILASYVHSPTLITTALIHLYLTKVKNAFSPLWIMGPDQISHCVLPPAWKTNGMVW